MKEKFTEIYRTHIKRPGAEDLLAYLEKSDFFTAPASTRFHLSVPGGLCQHSVNVYEQLHDQYFHYLMQTPGFSGLSAEQEETIAIVGLLHDLCKVGVYVPVKKSRKTGKNLPNGKPEWEDYWGYDYEDKLPYGHGEKSVYIASGFMRLTREEAMAIRWHMGAFQDGEAKEAGNAFGMYPLALFTHISDMLATNLCEQEEKK